MIKFTDLTKEDLKNLNLSGLKNVYVVTEILKNKKAYVFSAPAYSRLGCFLTITDYRQRTDDFARKLEFVEERTYESLDDFSIEDYMLIGLNEPSVKKYDWLKKFLNGEAEGVYSKEERSEIDFKNEFMKLKFENEKLKKENDLAKNLLKSMKTAFSAFNVLNESVKAFKEQVES